MTCNRNPPHGSPEQARALVVLGLPTMEGCSVCFLDGEDPPPEEPGPNHDLVPDGPFFEALAATYRLADANNRAALRYAFPSLSALIAWRRA